MLRGSISDLKEDELMKIRKLGWKQKNSFEEGIKKTLDYFQSLK